MNKINEAAVSWHQTKVQTCDSWEKGNTQEEETCACPGFWPGVLFKVKQREGKRKQILVVWLSWAEFGVWAAEVAGICWVDTGEESCGEERPQKSVWACPVGSWVKPGLGESRARLGEAYWRAAAKSLRTRWRCQRLCRVGSSSSARIEKP